MTYKTLPVGLAFLSVCVFYSIQTTTQAQVSNGEKKHSTSQTNCVTTISKEEMKTLLKTLTPQALKTLTEDPELKRGYVDNVKELLATACQAVKEGFAENNFIKQELEYIEAELTAAGYDREINKNSTPPFALITDNQIGEFYAKQENQIDFERFLKVKIQLVKERGGSEGEVSENDVKQAKDFFARMQMYFREARSKSDALPKEFWDHLDVSIKLQKAQMLSSIYTRKVLAGKLEVTDAEIQAYFAKHPETDTSAKKAKAEVILTRVKAGENFAVLAKQFNEDSATKHTAGLYKGVAEGQFVVEFETPALSLTDGQIYPQVVETPFGFHVIKLERKDKVKDQNGKLKVSYDVRHILISTMVNDPAAGSEVPVKTFVRRKLETEKERKILGDILANNPVSVAADFEVPKL